MPQLIPFKGVRAAPHMASHVISRTYQDYSDLELEALLRYNPFSFLHILNPGYKFSHSLKGEERFNLVRNRYLEFKEEKYLIQDEKPVFYIYERSDAVHLYTGIIGATSTDDYDHGLIKKHEETIEKREQLFKEYLKTVGFNAEPVLLTYPDDSTVDELIAKEKQEVPVYNFITTDHSRHKVWLITDSTVIRAIQERFKEMSHLYIADGHHRSSSSSLLAKDMGSTHHSYKHCMSYLIPESQLRIYEFNRLVKDLNGLSKEDFLMKLDMNFRIQNRGLELYKPSKKHHFSMYLDGEFYSLYLRKNIYSIDTPLADLDTQMLYDLILNPILGIDDLRDNDRLAYSYGQTDLLRIKEKVDRGDHAVGFGLVPATVDQMKSIADASLIMPPKSTYIRPKLPSGLTIYEFES